MAYISLSINPLHRCNFRCDFCYLTPDQLKSRQLLDLDTLSDRLHYLRDAGYNLQTVDVYGGEIELLPDDYYTQLLSIIKQHSPGHINAITNYYLQREYLVQPGVDLSVSFDFDCREHHETVFANILTSPHDVHVLMLASRCLISKDVDSMIDTLNTARNIKTVEVKPYSANQANQHHIPYTEYEQFVQKWITSSRPKNFSFVNEHLLRQSITGTRNAFSDDHLYIMPDGSFAVLDFDLNDNEYFMPIRSASQFSSWAINEKHRVTTNPFCGRCKYMGRCLTEHYRDVATLDTSCNGFKHLLEWYDARLES